MNAIIKNMTNTISISFTDCKWNDVIASVFGTGGDSQWENKKRLEIERRHLLHYIFPKLLKNSKKYSAAFFMLIRVNKFGYYK